MEFLWQERLCVGSYALIDLIGLSLVLIFWQRSPAACFLLLAACLLDMTTSVAHLFVEILGLKLEKEFLFDPIALALIAAHFVAHAMVLGAVFIGRSTSDNYKARGGAS